MHVSVINSDCQGDIIQRHIKLPHSICIYNFIWIVCSCLCIQTIKVTLHLVKNIKFINAQQEQMIYNYENTKENHLKTNVTIWFNKTVHVIGVCQLYMPLNYIWELWFFAETCGTVHVYGWFLRFYINFMHFKCMITVSTHRTKFKII